jgi:hypothetical protein
MKTKCIALALAAAAGLTSAVSAQVTLQLRRSWVGAESLFPLKVNNAGLNNFYIGGFIGSIEHGGSSSTLFLGGLSPGATPAGQAWKSQIVRLDFSGPDGILGSGNRAFTPIVASRNPTQGAAAQGYVSMDYRPATNVNDVPSPAQLLVGTDFNTTSRHTIYNLTATTPPMGTNFETAVGSLAAGGTAWDFGPRPLTGNLGTPEPLRSGFPVASFITFRSSGGFTGPIGMFRGDFSPLDIYPDGAAYFFGQNIGGSIFGNLPNSPRFMPLLATDPNLVVDTTNSQYRDMDFSPTDNGYAVARANNSLIVIQRGTDNQTINRVRFDIPLASNIVAQNVRYMDNAAGGDMIVWNNRNAFGGISFKTLFRITKVTDFTDPNPFPTLTPNDANPANRINIFNQAGVLMDDAALEAAFPTSGGVADFAWVPGEQRIIMVNDAFNGEIYVFDVIVAPTVSTDPQSLTINSGDNATFSVTAAGGNLSYQWRKGGNPLTNGGAIAGANSPTLTITGATAADAGSYDVVITNVAGSITSAAATLTVNGGGGGGCSPADIANTDGDPAPDGVIDNGDFTLFFAAFFLDPSDPNNLLADIANTDGDPGADGTVDNGDFTLFFSAFFTGCP